MLNYSGSVGYFLDDFKAPLPATPDLITGQGRMRVRGRDKVETHHKQKKKRARSIAKQSRRRNRA